MLLCRKLFLSVIIVLLFISAIPTPVSAHPDPYMGESKWLIGRNNIQITLELTSYLLEQIAGIKKIDSYSDKQLQQIAANIIKPYINEKLFVSVNGELYPVKLTRIYKLDYYSYYVYNIYLSVDNINFNEPVNSVQITYKLFFDETEAAHVNIAHIHLSDSKSDVVDFTADTPTWEWSIKGTSE